MTWLVDKLNRRVEVFRQEQQPNVSGGYTQKYEKVAGPVWAGCEPAGGGVAAYVRGVQIENAPTHKFTIRRSVPGGLCTAESNGYLKSDNFLFLLTNAAGTVGRLFRILTAQNVGELDEYIEIMAKEMGMFDTSRGTIA